MHRARPQLLEIAQRIAGIIDLEIHTLMSVMQIQLAAIVVVAILDIDKRLPEVRQAEQ